jgi:hypothetical protein
MLGEFMLSRSKAPWVILLAIIPVYFENRILRKDYSYPRRFWITWPTMASTIHRMFSARLTEWVSC